MKKYINIVLLSIIIVVVFLYSQKNNLEHVPTVSTQELIKGCYIATLDKDIYDLKINTQEDKKVSGVLKFNNFQKDSSSGSFAGTYSNGILLGIYTFQSEGAISVMQVIFKKVGSDFVRGYGNMSTTTNYFTDLNAIIYDDSAIFKTSPCVENQ